MSDKKRKGDWFKDAFRTPRKQSDDEKKFQEKRKLLIAAFKSQYINPDDPGVEEEMNSIARIIVDTSLELDDTAIGWFQLSVEQKDMLLKKKIESIVPGCYKTETEVHEKLMGDELTRFAFYSLLGNEITQRFNEIYHWVVQQEIKSRVDMLLQLKKGSSDPWKNQGE